MKKIEMELPKDILVKSIWTKNDLENLIHYLVRIADKKYDTFNKNIINTKSQTIGVRIPALRKIAKLIVHGNMLSFLDFPFPDIYECHILFALVLCHIKENEIAIKYFSPFIPSINNWAVCDILCGDYKIVSKNKDYYLHFIKDNISSNNEFVVRVCVILLMKNYLDMTPQEIFLILNKITYSPYYVEMGVAWMLSEYYLHYPNEVLAYIPTSPFSFFTKNKTYQKILESFRVSNDDKNLIRQERNKLEKPIKVQGIK